MCDVIVCDPDEKSFEGTNLGLLYTGVSRATTLGDADGLHSAIYFDGLSFRGDRIRNLICKTNSTELFEMAKKRRRWVRHLAENHRKSIPVIADVMQNAESIFQWASTKKYTTKQLYARIDTYKAR